VRLSVKQPPALGTPRDRQPSHGGGSGADGTPGVGEGTSPRTPVAVFEPEEPPPAPGGPPAGPPPSAAQASEGGDPAERLVRHVEVRAQAAAASGGAGGGAPRKRVQIYLNGSVLSARTSIVQALVSHATRMPRGGRPCGHEEGGPPPRRGVGPPRGTEGRFLVSAEDESSSEADDSAPAPGGGGATASSDAAPQPGSWTSHALGSASSSHTSSRHFCGAIWGRVHAMTYELVDDPQSSRGEGERAVGAGADAAGGAVDALVGMVATDFDCLVQRHSGTALRIAQLQSGTPGLCGSGGASAALTDGPEDPATSDLTPRSADCKEDGGDATPRGIDSSVAVDHEALAVMLQLISAFYNLYEYLRTNQGPLSSELSTITGLADEEDFQCNSLTSKLLRQLSDPLAICTGSIPAWCTKLSGSCRFLFPYSARRILHHSCNLGLSRALHHVQQRTLAQSAHSQEAQRRLEGEVAVASIPRQKVRISRQRILESAIKVMNLYGTSNTILEVEYVGEVGTGSGPTLEFYAQVAEILRTSDPRLFRQSVPGGMLFPEPWDAERLRRGGGEAAQIIERFRLLGQLVAKCILDSRLVDLQLHPFFWRLCLGGGPFSHRALRNIDLELHTSLQEMRGMETEALTQLCVDFTLPGHPSIELKPGGADIALCRANVEEYVGLVCEASLVSAVAPQVLAFRGAFAELLPLETCRIWSDVELASLIMGTSVHDDTFWTIEHLGAHIKAQHGYSADSRGFRDLLAAMSEFSADSRRKFLSFVTGAPTLPIGGFSGLKPPLTVVKKESPPAPLTPDQFMPSVMTCANYLKLPEYSDGEILRQKLVLAMNEGQSAFLLS